MCGWGDTGPYPVIQGWDGLGPDLGGIKKDQSNARWGTGGMRLNLGGTRWDVGMWGPALHSNSMFELAMHTHLAHRAER